MEQDQLVKKRVGDDGQQQVRNPLVDVELEDLRVDDDEPHLVAYSGIIGDGRQMRWLDLHHSDASKGGAIDTMKRLLGIERVICFGDSDNDLSMFATADESYAPANADDHIKWAATAVIGHHDDEGIARFLRERFDLGES